jgi:hypothetical protein
MEAFTSDFAATQAILGVGFIATIAMSAVYFFICKYFMENKLNLA